MAYKKNNNYYENNLVKKLIADREKRLNELQKKTIAWLENKDYFKLDKEKKKEFLLSSNGIALLEAMAREDLTTVEISSTLSLTQKDLHTFSRENPEIYDAIDRGRAEKINLVETALFEMARDREIEEEQIQEHWSDRNPDSRTYTKRTFKKIIPANFQAASYILNTHKNMEYRKQAEEALGDKAGVKFVIEMPEIEVIKKENKDNDG